ncbi:hypothetical protein M569_05293, partial [Genlisea aurea]
LILPLFVLSASVSALPTDADALLAFKADADFDHTLHYNLNRRFDYCHWVGVKCAQGRVVRYVLQSSALRGALAGATLTRLDQLRVLNLRNNSLAGALPDFSPLGNLKTLILDHNRFSGSFPPSFLTLHRLLVLDLSHNNFTGVVTQNLTALDRLTTLRLDSNGFSGLIPPLNQTALRLFNVSHNNFSGPIPLTPTLKSLNISSFLYNPNLCGELLNVPCRGDSSHFFNPAGAPFPPSPEPPPSQQGLLTDIPPPNRRNHRKKAWWLPLCFLSGGAILFSTLSIVFIAIRRRRRKRQGAEKKTELFQHKSEPETAATAVVKEAATSEAQGNGIIPQSGNLIFCCGEEQVYTLEHLMRASAELLGRGSIGTTYKAVMTNQLTLTVKRLADSTINLSFEQHMESVGVLRHPNLVPVRAYFQAKNERLIIYDFQQNGSLFNLLHGSRSKRAKPLHWTSCLKIAEDVAQGLAYIHQASTFIHGNLKSSNVLLGSDFEACLTDYCLVDLVDDDASSKDDDPEASAYRAPETRMLGGRRSAASDVYAFGVLLLELVTGKLPSKHPFVGESDTAEWVRAMREDDGGDDESRLRKMVEMGRLCRASWAEERPSMWHVLKMINTVKESV